MPDDATVPEVALPDAARMPALLSYVRQGRCALFVGAGLSRPAGYPGWRGLMDTILHQTVAAAGSDAKDVQRELGGLLDAGRYAEVADQCRKLLGRHRFWEILSPELTRPAEPPKQTHLPIVQTPYACIVTTNFDTLLEEAFGRWGDAGIPKAPTSAQLGDHGTLLLDGAFFILKAHGTIHEEASLVFTSEDYRRITHANPAFHSMMAAILLTHAVLFVGYSLSDPNFRLLLESQLSVFGTESPPRYALMDGVGRIESQILRRTAGIEVVSYPKGRHECVPHFLQTIADATRVDTSTPRRPELAPASRAPLPALVLSLRPRGAMLELGWFETTTDDLSGSRVPPGLRWVASTRSLPWMELSETPGDFTLPAMKTVGRLLGERLDELGIPLVPARPRLVMLDVPLELAGLPWEWTEVRGEALCMQVPLCRTVAGYNDASRGRPLPRLPLRILLVGDSLSQADHPHSLPGTRKEVEAIGECFRRASAQHHVTILVGAEACYQRVLREMSGGGYDIVHFAGVAYVDDAGESVLPLHDGHVRASEVATLLSRHPPSLLFVDEDCSGFVPAVGGSYAATLPMGTDFADFYDRMRQHRPGLERVVGRAGVGTFIGCMAPAQEKPAREIAIRFYRSLLSGSPIAEAFFQARIACTGIERATALLFAMAGYPDLVLAQADGSPVRPDRSRRSSKRTRT